MNKSNHLRNLPQADQDLILHLCDNHPYHDVVERLLKPRSEGGLGLKTSTSILCRFYLHHQKDLADQALLAQYGKALQIRREQNPGASLTGILALVETRLLASLKAGRAIADLTEEFRTLARVHKTYVSDFQLRSQKGGPASQLNYRQYVNDQAASPNVDFTSSFTDTTFTDDEYAPEEFNHLSQEALDIRAEADRREQAEFETFVREKARLEKERAAQLQAAEAKAAAAKAARASQRTPGLTDEEWQRFHPWAKTPVIPTIPVLSDKSLFDLGRRNKRVHAHFPEILDYLDRPSELREAA